MFSTPNNREQIMKIPDWLDNVVLVAQAAKKRPKIAVAVLLVLGAIAYRAPAIVSCTWEATASQSVPWDLWRHNMWTNECQYFNGKRWIRLDKVMDVGAGSDAEDLEDFG